MFIVLAPGLNPTIKIQAGYRYIDSHSMFEYIKGYYQIFTADGGSIVVFGLLLLLLLLLLLFCFRNELFLDVDYLSSNFSFQLLNKFFYKLRLNFTNSAQGTNSKKLDCFGSFSKMLSFIKRPSFLSFSLAPSW